MKQPDAFDLMEELRHDSWCVVLKCLPKEMSFIIEGSRSEYDTPSDDKLVGKGKWCCEATCVRNLVDADCEYRHSQTAFDESPLEAVRKVFFAVARDNDRRKDHQQRTAK